MENVEIAALKEQLRKQVEEQGKAIASLTALVEQIAKRSVPSPAISAGPSEGESGKKPDGEEKRQTRFIPRRSGEVVKDGDIQDADTLLRKALENGTPVFPIGRHPFEK